MRKLSITCFVNQLFVEETFEQFALQDQDQNLDFVNLQTLLKFRLLFSAPRIKQIGRSVV